MSGKPPVASRWPLEIQNRRRGGQQSSLGFGRFRSGDFADMLLEVLVFASEQFRQGVAKVLSATPLAHVVLPRLPEALGLLVHLLLIDQQVGALEKRNQDVEDGELAFALLVGQRLVR